MSRLLPLLPLLLLALLSRPGFAGDVQDSFDAGVAYTRDGEHVLATQTFVEALDHGAVDPAVLHGLGNALWRQGHQGYAIAAWQRGLVLRPSDADLAANLAYARRQTSDRLAPPQRAAGPFFWTPLLSVTAQAVVASSAATLGLSLWAAIAWRRRRDGSPTLRPPGLSLALLGAAAVAAAGVAWSAGVLPPTVVLAPEVSVRSAIGAEGVELFVLHEGAVVGTLERHEGGTEGGAGAAVLIELPDARKGWVPADAVDVADPGAPFPLPAG